MKTLKQTTLAAAITSALALGLSGQAAASVYGGSALEVQNLAVTLTNANVGTFITSFQFTATNTAILNGASAGTESANCFGTPTPGGSNNCNNATPRLDPAANNAPGSTAVRANNDFSLFGPSLNQYANSDSVIYKAELTGDGPTHAQQIAESELQYTGAANSNAEITSNTGFVMNFIVNGIGQLDVSFEADPYLRVAINDPLFITGNAQANINATFTLTNLDTGGQISWAPQGTLANDCSVDASLTGVTCDETADDEDLNRNISTSINNSNLPHSLAASFGSFGMSIKNLINGNYNLAFNALTSNSVSLRQVPEPSVIALLGLGLVGLGFATRRRK